MTDRTLTSNYLALARQWMSEVNDCSLQERLAVGCFAQWLDERRLTNETPTPTSKDQLLEWARRIEAAYGDLPSDRFPGPPTNIVEEMRTAANTLEPPAPPSTLDERRLKTQKDLIANYVEGERILNAAIERLQKDLRSSHAAYNAMLDKAAQLERNAHETLPPRITVMDDGRAMGGSDVCHTCAAHCTVINDLETALRGLYWDNVDYLTLNKLGGMQNHWMRAARMALGMDVDDVRPTQKASEQRPLEKAVCKHGNGPTCFECSSESEPEQR